MDRSGRSLLWRLAVLVGCISAALIFFASLEWDERFATDVTVLLPDADVDDHTARLLAQVREHEERLILGALVPPENGWDERREAAANALLLHLCDSGLFAQVAEGPGPRDPDALTESIYTGRLDFLLPQWAESVGVSVTEPNAERWAHATVASLEAFLVRPEASAFSEVIPSDPFPLAAYMADAAEEVITPDESGPVLFWAVQNESPFTPGGQQPVLAAFEGAEEAALEVVSESSLRFASVAAFAVESENRIRREITRLNAFGLFLVALVAFVFLRQRTAMLHLVAIAALSVTGGLSAILLFFPVVHILSLVVGGLLVGVAVDYGIHILLHQSNVAGAGFAETLREVRKPLLASALSTAAGFAALTFADLLLLRQIGIFVAGGLLSAWAASWIYFPLWKKPPEVARFAAPPVRGSVQPLLLAVAAVLLLLPLLGWLRLEWKDDLRELQPPMPEQWEADEAVRQLFSQGGAYTGWLSPGDNPLEARALLARFTAQWEEAGGDRADLVSLAPLVAQPEKRDAVRATFAGMSDFEEVLKERLAESGFEADEFAPFFVELEKWLSDANPSYEYRIGSVEAALDGPSGILLREGDDTWWFFVSAPVDAIPDAWEAPADVVAVTQLETLNELFAEYRRAAWRISGVAFLVIAGGVLLAYGPGAGAIGLLLPALAWAWGMGAVAGLFSPLNLFHLLGGFLGFCVALDYGLFFRHARASGRGLPLSIRLSAATTLSAFGVLAFSTIPAVAALGTSVFAVVLGGLFLVEVSSRFPSKQRQK